MLESIRPSQKGSVYSTEFRRGSSRAVAQACPGQTERHRVQIVENRHYSPMMNIISAIFIRSKDLDECAYNSKIRLNLRKVIVKEVEEKGWQA